MKVTLPKILLSACALALLAGACRPASKANPYKDKAEEMFATVWSKYRLPEYGLFSEHYPSHYKPDLNYFQDSTHQARETSYLWPLSGVFSSVNLLMELDARKYKPYLDSMVTAVEMYYDNTRLPAGYQAYPVRFAKVDRYYDDNGLVGIDYIDAYQITQNPAYLSKAREVMTFILSGLQNDGTNAVPWLEGHTDQRPACSNGKAMILSLKLYEATKEEAYLKHGKDFYRFMSTYLRDDSLNIVWNSWLTAGKGEVQKHAYTYNTGMLIQAAVRLYRLTNEAGYLNDARALAEGSFRYYVKYTPEGTPYISDLPWFVIVLFRGYHELYAIDGDTKYVGALIKSADWAWVHARDNTGLIYNDWTGRADEKTRPKWLLDEACMIEIYARAATIKF